VASENGWEPAKANPDQCEWVTVPGTDVTLQLLKGQPAILLRAWAADWNAYLEPLRDPDSAGWTPTNAVATSNHLNGTAIDLNWESHPFRRRGSLNAGQMRVMAEMEDFYAGTVFWAGRWDNPVDEMHSQMGYHSFNNPHTQEFIDQHVRADGFSRFRRGDAPPPAPSAMTVPLIQTAPGRWSSLSPAWAHLINRESGGDPTIIQQIIDVNSGGNEAEGLFQITPRTWRANNGTEFAATPRLATPQQQAIVAARIFTRNPSGSDWGAGLPGREDPTQLAAGLVPITAPPPPQEDDEMSAEVEQMIRELYAEYNARREAPTRSLFGMDLSGVESPLGFLWNTDANVWDQKLTWAYLFGVTRAEEYVHRVAEHGVSPESWAGQTTDESGRWLAEFGQQYCRGLISFRAALQKALLGPQQQPNPTERVDLPAPTDVPPEPPPSPPLVPAPVAPTSTGKVIGELSRSWFQKFQRLSWSPRQRPS
jgi:hypothetical protein